MTWVVNTSTNTCHIYHYQKKPARLTLVKEIIHPENRLKTGEYLTSDKPGHYHAESSHGAFIPRTDPKSAAIDSFSREIAKELDQGRKSNSYESLIIITPAHMHGLLFQHLDKNVKEMVTHNIQKDLQHLKDHELLAYLQTHTKFPGES